MTDAELHDLIPLHALGALEPSEVPLLEAYLASNPEAQASYVWYLEAVTILARAIPLEEPAQDLKAKMLDRVRSVNGADQTRAGQTQANPIQASERSRTTPVPPMPSSRQAPRASRTVWRPRPFLPVALGAMGVMAIAGLLLQNVQLNTRLQALETSQQSLEAVLNSSQTRLVVLNSSDTKTAVGRLLVGPDGLVQISHTMSKNASGHTWQAWYILKGESTPRPLETTNESHLMIRVPANAQVVAISEEPVGGSLVPTTVRAIATL
jgi:Anti-sigma-K factor rskA